ncbi:hypothetical protein tinsulaeT_30390 [Thalassotalea insulae]|uniref:Lipoprotein n=1 Tax=Thalassotalea insulae TaxID=2056778 RepID=A0ABQ6GWJ4_9GAMM|nr:hypothetical protein [Thalassotalea insulae]GLX79699.1 hypothetical protein tinsulaeT_30390 [Thalassotalea insulae]
MQMKSFFKVSAIASALSLTLVGCGGDINLKSDVDNSVGDTVINNPEPVDNGGNLDSLPGIPNTAMSTIVSTALGFDVQVQTIEGNITEDTTLVATLGNKPVMYALKGQVTVGLSSTGSSNSSAKSGVQKSSLAANGATLTIEPGAVLFGQSGKDYLVIQRNSKIMAEGTKAKPIVFTSLADVQGEETAAGQWGGVVILGNAPSNKCPTDGSECALQVEGVEEGAVFGGTDWEDNSGVLKYVVVKYAGYELSTDNELNGITFGGVGSGTTVDYIQIHSNADDGIEFFGGAVDLKHVVLTGNQDDSLDIDNGYRGRIQHVFIQHDKNSGKANRGIEADNDGKHPDKEPMSMPTITNITIMGNNYKGDDRDSEGIYLREGVGAHIYNAVVTGTSEMGECLELEGGKTSSVTVDNANNGNITFQNSIIACSNGENFKNAKANQDTNDTSDDTVLLDVEQWFLSEESNGVSTSLLIDADGMPDSNSPLVAEGAGQNVANTVDPWFDEVHYVGALDGSNDWRQGWAFGFGGGEVTASAPVEGCPAGTTAISPIDGATTTCEISGTITSDITLTANNIYALNGAVFVGHDKADSATLTIESGTTIFGRNGKDYLVVSRDSKIEANGTASAPITFTSSEDLKGEATHAGQWGGIVLLGNAKSNKCPTDGSECALQVEGVEEGAVFGGTNDEDSSGTLRYVVVKHAGYELSTDNELNGITFGAIGSGTKVEYIQIHDNADDGVEFFGGTVNLKYVVLTDNQDDSVDWDNGYRGNMQYVLVRQNPENGETNRGIEADNDGKIANKKPQSNPTIANVTIIGNDYKGDDKDSEGIYLREGTKAHLYNFVVTGSAGMGECFEIEGGKTSSVTVDQAKSGETVISNSVFACSENFKDSYANQDTADKSDDVVLLNAADWVLNSNENNSTATGKSDVVNGIYTLDATTPKTFTNNTFFDNADHIGAVSESNDWTAGWTVGLE